jgi:hypothetical protein
MSIYCITSRTLPSYPRIRDQKRIKASKKEYEDKQAYADRSNRLDILDILGRFNRLTDNKTNKQRDR